MFHLKQGLKGHQGLTIKMSEEDYSKICGRDAVSQEAMTVLEATLRIPEFS